MGQYRNSNLISHIIELGSNAFATSFSYRILLRICFLIELFCSLVENLYFLPTTNYRLSPTKCKIMD